MSALTINVRNFEFLSVNKIKQIETTPSVAFSLRKKRPRGIFSKSLSPTIFGQTLPLLEISLKN